MSARQVDEVPSPTRPGHWILPHWDRPDVTAGITDASLDLRLADRSPDDAQAAWSALISQVPGARAAVASRQVHGQRVMSHPVPARGFARAQDADGHLTNAPGALMAVTVADCVPIYLRDDATGWVGMLHAGWRGIAAGILERAIARLRVAGSKPENIVMHCGVSICGSCYEVGPEVHAAVESRRVSGPAPIDLRQVLVGRAREVGVKAMTVSGLCAREHEAFHSHRGSGGGPARMAAYVARRSP